ncbi:hypothetical protein LTR08_005078 [Meristemomyces frigidus]|nr:hypothetical protein LTR08_005078 [Meristemomyces frigidus]
MAFPAPPATSINYLLDALAALYDGGKYSDLTITCNYRQWAVHKAVLCSRSGFFDGACSNPFAEASSGIIDLSEDDQEAVEQMIQYFYHLDYLNEPEQPRATVFRHRALSDARRRMPKKLDLSQCHDPLLEAAGVYAPGPATPPISATSPTDSSSFFDSNEKAPRSPGKRAKTPPLMADDGSDYESYDEEDELPEDESHLILHTRVYALAEKYDIPSLKALARSKFETAMACHYDSPELPEAIEEVYCSTIDNDRGLRDIVLDLFRYHTQLVHTPDIFTVIKGTPTLAMELFKVERGLPV